MLMMCSTYRAHHRKHRHALSSQVLMFSVINKLYVNTFANAAEYGLTRLLLNFKARLLPVAQAEAQRLGAVLAAFPTSQAQDQALLAAGQDDAGGPADWQTRRILEFRIERKRALR